MIDVGTGYEQIASSRVRPKVEPYISAFYKDEIGDIKSVDWDASKIKNLKFKRSIDPIGRELPYYELSWEEIYRGAVDEYNHPTLYKGVGAYSSVDFQFIQSSVFSPSLRRVSEIYSTWKDTIQNYSSWKHIFNLPKTWKEIMEKRESTFSASFPTMFLTATPVVEKNVIKWTARDVFHFLNLSQSGTFKKDENEHALDFITRILSFEIEKAPDGELENYLNNTLSSLADWKEEMYIVPYTFSYDGLTKDLMLHCLNVWNMSFKPTDGFLGVEKINYDDLNVMSSFSKDIMYEPPIYTRGKDVSQYKYVGYDESGNGTNFTTFQEDVIGDSFEEDNPLFPHENPNEFGSQAKERRNIILNYFRKDNGSLEFTSLSDLRVEPLDFVEVETNFVDENGKNLMKRGIVVSVEFEYAGYLKQKTIVHEYNEIY